VDAQVKKGKPGMLFSDTTTTLRLNHQLSRVNRTFNKTLERLSSGLKVNHASDGAATVAISETLRSQIRGFDAASSNVQQGIGMLEIADSGLQQITESLQKIREIGVAASNGTTTATQFATYQASLQAELATIDALAGSTKYGSQVLLNGSISGGSGLNIQTGPETTDTLDIKTAFGNNTSGASGLGITQSTLASTANATTLINQTDAAIATIGNNLATIGGFENRLANQLNYLSTAKVNVSASRSSLIEVDVASETGILAQMQLLQQAGAYALAQNNLNARLVLSLLQ
jgi:flagellin